MSASSKKKLRKELNAQKLTEKQQSVLNLLEDVGAASVKEVCYFSGVTPAVVNALAQKGLVQVYDAEVLRTPYGASEEIPPIVSRALNEEQQQAYDQADHHGVCRVGGRSFGFFVVVLSHALPP